MHRESSYYILAVITPMLIITLMAFVSFTLKLDNLSSRVSLSTLSSLTVSSIHAASRGTMIPRSAGLTWLDIFMLGCLIFAYVPLAWTVSLLTLREFMASKLASRFKELARDQWTSVHLPAPISSAPPSLAEPIDVAQLPPPTCVPMEQELKPVPAGHAAGPPKPAVGGEEKQKSPSPVNRLVARLNCCFGSICVLCYLIFVSVMLGRTLGAGKGGCASEE